jgi:GTP pyrophosphokinase
MTESFADTPLLTGRFDEALHYATRHHSLQLRRGTTIPYVAHVLSVAALTLEMNGDEDEAIGALLHDVVEDGGGQAALDDIDARFGDVVAQIVADNSDWIDDGTGEQPSWWDRKRAYVTSIAAKDPASLRVSLADKIHNSRSILLDYREVGDAIWARFKQGQGIATRIYYRELAAAFERERGRMGEAAGPYVEELRRTVDAITAHAEELQGPDRQALFTEG